MIPDVAVALRGGRGSQRRGGDQRDRRGPRGGRPPGRPRIATPATSPPRSASSAWRSPSRATEDRNRFWAWATTRAPNVAVGGDPRIATASPGPGRITPRGVAVALRGDRESQLISASRDALPLGLPRGASCSASSPRPCKTTWLRPSAARHLPPAARNRRSRRRCDPRSPRRTTAQDGGWLARPVPCARCDPRRSQSATATGCGARLRQRLHLWQASYAPKQVSSFLTGGQSC